MSLDTTDSRGENAVSTAQARTTAAHWRAMAAHRGQAVAVRTPDESITLRTPAGRPIGGPGPYAAAVDDARVPIAVESQIDVASVISVLAVLCTGHPVILLDPFPPRRTSRPHPAAVGCAEAESGRDHRTSGSGRPGARGGPDDPSILIFTSGSHR